MQLRARQGRAGMLMICCVGLWASCTHTPDRGPESPRSQAPLTGYFVGVAHVTENWSTTEHKTSRTDVTLTLLQGEYTITAAGDDLHSSVGDYFQSYQLHFRQRTSELGPDSEPALRGGFDYRWSGRLLVLEQWDAQRDRLVQVILERTSRAEALLPNPAPDAATPGRIQSAKRTQ